MTTIECDCGEVFDTERDEIVPGQDTTRCPACGTQNDVPGTDGGGGVEVSTADHDGRLEIHIHIHQ